MSVKLFWIALAGLIAAFQRDTPSVVWNRPVLVYYQTGPNRIVLMNSVNWPVSGHNVQNRFGQLNPVTETTTNRN